MTKMSTQNSVFKSEWFALRVQLWRFDWPRNFILNIQLLAGLVLNAAEPPHSTWDEKHRAFFKDNCVECHNEKKQKGKLRLDDISFVIDSVESADRWQKILNQLNSGEMPPDDAKQPERGAKTEFLDSLSHSLMAARRSLGDAGGKITMRRLNRREYKNTIRDLLGVETDARVLPADGGAGTFDTVGSSLFMSSDQTPSLPDARPRSGRFRCGWRESNFLRIYSTALGWL